MLPGIRVVVVDDEPLALTGLVRMLREDPELEIVAECLDGEAAISAIGLLRPHLVFLDVQMPEVSGFDVLRRLGPGPKPMIVFVTAYDRFAVSAFEVNAIDYLLKPFDDARLAEAVRRVKRGLRQASTEELATRLSRLLAGLPDESRSGRSAHQGKTTGPSTLAVRDGGRVRFVPVRDLEWIEGADYYVRLHTGGKSLLMRESLTSLESRLDPQRFVRVHRSAIVNVTRIRELRPDSEGGGVLILASGASIRFSRSRRGRIQELTERSPLDES
jgi:two-component system, LytTR family, response regulator